VYREEKGTEGEREREKEEKKGRQARLRDIVAADLPEGPEVHSRVNERAPSLRDDE